MEHTLVPRSQWLRVAPWIKFTVTQITPVICHICLACFMHKCPRNDPGNSSTFVARLAWLLLGDLDLDLSSVQWSPTTTWYVGGQQKQHLSRSPSPALSPSIMYSADPLQRRHRRPDADAPVAVSPSAPVDQLAHAPRLLVTRSVDRATRPAGSLMVTVHVSSAVTLMDWSSIVCTPVLHTELSVFLLSATCCTLQNTLGRKRKRW